MKKKTKWYVLIAVVVIAVLLPCYLKMHQHKARYVERSRCISHLTSLKIMKSTYAKEKGLMRGQSVSIEEVLQFGETEMPICPAGGQYTIGDIGDDPMCSYRLPAWSSVVPVPFVKPDTNSAVYHSL